MDAQLDKENINRLSDDQLRAKLKECGITYGPILPSTRYLYEKKLLNFLTTGNTTLNTTTANVSVLADSTLNKTNNRAAAAVATSNANIPESPRTRRQTTHKEVEVEKVKTLVEKTVTTTTTSNTPKKLVEIEHVTKPSTQTSRKENNYEMPEPRSTKSHNEDKVYSSNLMNISELRNLPAFGDESYVKPTSRSQHVETMNKPAHTFTQENHYAPRKVIEAEQHMASTISPSKVKISSTSNNTYRMIDSNPIGNGIVFSATSTLARPVKHSEAVLLASEEPIPQPPQRHKLVSERPSLMQENTTTATTTSKPYLPQRLHTQPMNSMTPDKFASRLSEYGMLKTTLNNDLVSKSTSSIRSRPPMHKESMLTTSSGLATSSNPASSTASSKPTVTMTRSESTTVSSSTTDKKTDQKVNENKTGFFSSKLGYSILVMILTSMIYIFFMMLQTNPTDPLME